jgi:TonB family protein
MSTDKTPEPPPPTTTGTGSRPGAMTMAMQAVSAKTSGPKVLRIGLIQAGKIVEERVIRRRESVTVGSSEKNHFVIHTEGMPARFELFQLIGSDYILNFTNLMTGRVGLPGGVQDLTQMRDNGAARNAGTHYQVKINDNSRGKVVIGGTTLLFQFIAPPPVQPRPQLPAAARAGFVRSIDWLFTAFMVFTFMSMFGFIVYLENADWPIDNGSAVVPEELAKMIFEEPVPPPPELPEQAEDQGKQEEAQQTKAPEKPAKEPAKAEAPGPKEDSAEQQQAVAEKSARIAQEAAQAAEALIVGALGAEGGALADVLAGGAVTGNAQDILSQAAGIGVAKSGSGGDLRQRSGGGNSGVSGLGSLARKEGTTGAVGEGEKVVERTVKGSVKTSPGDEVGGTGEFDSNVVVSTIKARLRAIQMCYEQQLRRNPTLAGKVTIEFTIQPRGNVTDVKVKDNSTGDAAVGTCVANTVSTFRFNPGPEGGSVTYSYPFVFAPQN